MKKFILFFIFFSTAHHAMNMELDDASPSSHQRAMTRCTDSNAEENLDIPFVAHLVEKVDVQYFQNVPFFEIKQTDVNINAELGKCPQRIEFISASDVVFTLYTLNKTDSKLEFVKKFRGETNKEWAVYGENNSYLTRRNSQHAMKNLNLNKSELLSRITKLEIEEEDIFLHFISDEFYLLLILGTNYAFIMPADPTNMPMCQTIKLEQKIGRGVEFMSYDDGSFVFTVGSSHWLFTVYMAEKNSDDAIAAYLANSPACYDCCNLF